MQNLEKVPIKIILAGLCILFSNQILASTLSPQCLTKLSEKISPRSPTRDLGDASSLLLVTVIGDIEAEAKEGRIQTEAAQANNYTSESIDPRGKQDVGILFLHGLWGSHSQFDTWKRYAVAYGANYIALTLKGNHLRYSEAPQTSVNDWMREAEAALERLLESSHSVVIAGQSTGGAIAVRLASQARFANQVRGLILVEPALKVRPILSTGSCLLRGWYGDELANFARIFGVHYGNSSQSAHGREYVGLGCLVDQVISSASESNSRTELYSRIRAKSVVLITEPDKIIQNEANRQFVASQGSNSRLMLMSTSHHGSALWYLSRSQFRQILREDFQLRIRDPRHSETISKRLNYSALEEIVVGTWAEQKLRELRTQLLFVQDFTLRVPNDLLEVGRLLKDIEELAECVPAFQRVTRGTNQLRNMLPPLLLHGENLNTYKLFTDAFGSWLPSLFQAAGKTPEEYNSWLFRSSGATTRPAEFAIPDQLSLIAMVMSTATTADNALIKFNESPAWNQMQGLTFLNFSSVEIKPMLQQNLQQNLNQFNTVIAPIRTRWPSLQVELRRLAPLIDRENSILRQRETQLQNHFRAVTADLSQ